MRSLVFSHPWWGALLAATALVGCGEPRRSVTLKSANETLFACKNATISDLTPAGGGYKYVCAEPAAQLYIIFDTSDRKDGTLERIERVGGETQTFLPAVDAAAAGCDQAAALERTTGEAPPPRGKPGRFVLAMARPCGEVTLEVGDL